MLLSLRKNVLPLTVLLLLLSITLQNTVPNETSASAEVSPCLSNHAPITILNDNNFTDYAFAGDGSVETPFIIEDMVIITDSDYAIKIEHTTKHFVIRNCTLEARYYSIDINNASTETVKVFNNTCKNSYTGISLQNCNSSIVANNTLYNHKNYGIQTWYYSLIENNTCFESRIGIYILNHCVYRNNRVYNGGFYSNYAAQFSRHAQVESNFVNDKPLGFLINQTDTIVEENYYGQLFLYDCLNVSISNQNISNTNYAFLLGDCVNITISNNLLTDNHLAIFAFRIFSSNITDNFVSGSTSNGIHLAQTEDLVVSNNTCFRNQATGIFTYKCASSNFTYNLLQSNGGYGIELSGTGFYESEDNIVHHNAFFFNKKEGTSQANDEGHNTWFDSNTSQGNFWDTWDQSDGYLIDGTGSVDLYPLTESPINPLPEETDETNGYPFSVVIVTVLFCIILLNRKRKEKFLTKV